MSKRYFEQTSSHLIGKRKSFVVAHTSFGKHVKNLCMQFQELIMRNTTRTSSASAVLLFAPTSNLRSANSSQRTHVLLWCFLAFPDRHTCADTSWCTFTLPYVSCSYCRLCCRLCCRFFLRLCCRHTRLIHYIVISHWLLTAVGRPPQLPSLSYGLYKGHIIGM